MCKCRGLREVKIVLKKSKMRKYFFLDIKVNKFRVIKNKCYWNKG